ncbi:unnamed protein product [Mortierella alpina]
MTPSRSSRCCRQLFILAAAFVIALSMVSASDPQLLDRRALDHESDDYELEDPEESAPLLSTPVKQDTTDEYLYPPNSMSEVPSEHHQSQVPSSISQPAPSLAGKSSNSSSIDNDSLSSETGPSTIDPRSPASRLSLVKPKLNQANPSLFPIGSRIDLEWVFDQKTLLVPPRSLTLEAALVSDPSRVWPIANISGSATSARWDTAKVKEHLSTGLYTLHVYDPMIGKQGIATNGHLVPYSDLQFGLYVPGANLAKTGDTHCGTCRFDAININASGKTVGDPDLVTIGRAVLCFIFVMLLK